MSSIENLHNVMVEAFRSKDFNTCLDIAGRILVAEPENIVAIRFAARILAKQRERNLAKPLWLNLIKLEPDSPEPYLQVARIARVEKNWAECNTHINRFIGLTPDHPEALKIQFECFVQRLETGKIPAAFANLCRVGAIGLAPLVRQAAQLGMNTEIAITLQKSAENGDRESAKLRDELANAERDAAIGHEIRQNRSDAADCYRLMQIYLPDSVFAIAGLARQGKAATGRGR